MYTPASSAELERVLKLLQRYYPRRTAGECRETLALMYGHESWTLLETAAICGEPSAYDDEEAEALVAARREHHLSVAHRHLAGATEAAAITAARIEKDLATAGGLSISMRHDPYWRRQRVERARYACDLAYARHAVDEIRPTAREPLAMPPDDQGLHASVRVELLPRALALWLERQRPRFDGLVDRIAAIRVRQHSQCDLLGFAFQWGEACVARPTEIPEALQIYPLALCAKWYGWNACGLEARAPVSGPGLLAQRKFEPAASIADPTLGHQLALLRAQPREDVAAMSVPMRERQMAAGYALLGAHMREAAAAQPICRFIAKPAYAAVARRAAS